TVEGRVAHSLHAYFLRRGDVTSPIVYEVDRSRDGGSFSNRRVVAIQHGRPILNLAASFQNPEDGVEHEAEMPDVRGPEGLTDLIAAARDNLDSIPTKMRRYLQERPFEFRHVEPITFERGETRPPVKHVWIRAVDELPDDPVLHQNMLTYVSDHELVGTASNPHGQAFLDRSVIMASLDHALWFHRAVRVDDWLLYAMDSPNASGARGFARGQFFTRDGKLVASTAQEGLMRVVDRQERRARSDPKLQK
ncbi:MAG: acyl-CoA thioesterase II, partial [Pseudomonadota bacterium]